MGTVGARRGLDVPHFHSDKCASHTDNHRRVLGKAIECGKHELNIHFN